MRRSLHPKKDIEAALKYAEERGWRVEVGGSHAWGTIFCPYNDDECRCGEFCITSVWSTPGRHRVGGLSCGISVYTEIPIG